MLRERLVEALKKELREGLREALLAEATKANPNQAVSLGSLKRQAEEIKILMAQAQYEFDVARTKLEELSKALTQGNEIGPDFIGRAVDAYISRQVL